MMSKMQPLFGAFLFAITTYAQAIPITEAIDYTQLTTQAKESSAFLTPHRDQGQIVFRLSGGQPEESYALLLHYCNDQASIEHRCTLDTKGYLLFPNSSNRFSLLCSAFAPGEPVEFYLFSPDQEITKGRVVPQPLEVASEAYELSIELTHTNQLFRIVGKGFDPEETITVASGIDEERKVTTRTASSEGDLAFLMIPGSINEPGGEAHIELSGNKGLATLTFAWGDAMKEWQTVIERTHYK